MADNDLFLQIDRACLKNGIMAEEGVTGLE